MMCVGITGGIASGKSTVTNFFRELGAFVIDWDVLARQVVQPRLKAWEGLIEYFGKEILDEDLTINRQKLAELVFNDREKLEKLNQIVHPEIFKEDQRLMEESRKLDPNTLVIKDIPLLAESGETLARALVDRIIVVYASEKTQLRRLMEKGLSKKDAKSRIKAQLPISEKIKFADFVIYNDSSLEETKRQVERVYILLKGEEKYGTER